MTTSGGDKNPMLEQMLMSSGDKSEYQTLYRRQTTGEVQFGFDDFQMINIIGKGTFGKVWFSNS